MITSSNVGWDEGTTLALIMGLVLASEAMMQGSDRETLKNMLPLENDEGQVMSTHSTNEGLLSHSTPERGHTTMTVGVSRTGRRMSFGIGGAGNIRELKQSTAMARS